MELSQEDRAALEHTVTFALHAILLVGWRNNPDDIEGAVMACHQTDLLCRDARSLYPKNPAQALNAVRKLAESLKLNVPLLAELDIAEGLNAAEEAGANVN